MYAMSYPPVRGRRPIGPYQARSPTDAAWRSTWPFLIANIIAIAMILCTVIIGALEIASLAKSTNTDYYGNTSSTGAGFWCGFFFILAAVAVILLNFMRRTRLWALIALIANIVAACFAIILLGLDAAAVDYAKGHWWFGLPNKAKVLIAQLVFAIIQFLLSLAIIGIWIAVMILVRKRLRQHRQMPHF